MLHFATTEVPDGAGQALSETSVVCGATCCKPLH